MGITSQVANGGWGGLAIYIYSYGLLDHWNVASGRALFVLAAAPALLIMFTVYRLNHRLNDFWAGGNLKESTAKIQQITGENDSYHSAGQRIQETVDEFDEKAFGHHVGILSGIILAIASPITGYIIFDIQGGIGGGIASLVLIWGLSIRSYNELNQLARDISVPYEENYENQ